MTYLIYALVIVTAWHFLWEVVLAPSFRLRLRYEMFCLRDELRWLYHRKPDGDDKEVFRYLQGSVNSVIRLLPGIDFSLRFMVERAIAKDEQLRERIKKRRKRIDACGNREVRQLEGRIVRVARQAFIVNTGGWLIYLAPLAIAFLCFDAITRFVRDALLLPESELKRITRRGTFANPQTV